MRGHWRVLLFLWIVGIVLPMAWLAQFWPTSARIFGFLFGPLWMHVLMHAFLFAVLGWLVAHAVKRSLSAARRAGLPTAWLAVAVVAVLQEGIQLSYKARPWGGDEMLDVAVDIAAGALGAVVRWRYPEAPQ